MNLPEGSNPVPQTHEDSYLLATVVLDFNLKAEIRDIELLNSLRRIPVNAAQNFSELRTLDGSPVMLHSIC